MRYYTSRSIHTDNNHIFVHKTNTQKTKKKRKKKKKISIDDCRLKSVRDSWPWLGLAPVRYGASFPLAL